jgi:hypothetical protein
MHETLQNVARAQQINATLCGRALHDAALRLIDAAAASRAIVMAFDAAGERILGAALVLAEEPLEVFDYTATFPADRTCLLVGGVIAGPVGVAGAAGTVTAAGARRVEAALMTEWSDQIEQIARIRNIGLVPARVA